MKLKPMKEWSRSRKVLLVALVVVGLIAVIWGQSAFERTARREQLTRAAKKLGATVPVWSRPAIQVGQFRLKNPLDFITPLNSSEEEIDVHNLPNFDNQKLQQLVEIIENYPVPVNLQIINCPQITNLSPLDNCHNIISIICRNNPQLTNLSPLGTIPYLKSLMISNSFNVSDWTFLKNLTQLEHLILIRNSGITNLDFVKNLTKLESLGVKNSPKIKAIPALSSCPKLTVVSFSGCTNLTDMSALFSEEKKLTGEFYLKDTSVPTEQILKLKKQFPDCNFTYNEK